MVGALDAAAGEDPFRGHEDVAGRAAPHQHLGPAGAGASQYQGGGVPGALAAADARGVGQVLGDVEGLSRGGHR